MAASPPGAVNTDDRSDAIVLDDDKPATKEFEGATLQIGTSEDVERGIPDVRNSEPSALSRERPGSVIGRTSVKSTASRTSVRPGLVKSDESSQSFYSYKVLLWFYATFLYLDAVLFALSFS